ncbi:MAG: TIGR03067 domain-containing protein [Gemmataceae bacterium]
MATRFLVALLGLAVMIGFSTADDKKDEKKAAPAFDAAKLEGTWTLKEGKKAGAALSDDGKKGTYVITKDKITIKDGDGKDTFVMKYTVDGKASPVTIDMEILEGPGDGVKGAKAKGIVEVTDDTLKICYDAMGGDRPTKLDGEKAYYFVLSKKKEDKK